MLEMVACQQLVLLSNSNVVIPPDNPPVTVQTDAEAVPVPTVNIVPEML
jgi:hypothetical protein